jgi:hypothetical protein
MPRYLPGGGGGKRTGVGKSPKDYRAGSQQPALGCEMGDPNFHPVGCEQLQMLGRVTRWL